MLSLKQFLIKVAQSIYTLNNDKVDKTSTQVNLNTSAASTSTDGKLYSAITALGWGSEVIES